MKFVLAQIREALPITQDTYRHWKSTLAPLSNRNAHTRCFSASDFLALAIVKSMTDDLGVRVGALGPFASDLFDLCGRSSWASLERSTLIFELAARRVDLAPETQAQLLDQLAIIVPCRPIVIRLREYLSIGHAEQQQEPLRFPPTAVGGTRRGHLP
jgi:hypothetical protein